MSEELIKRARDIRDRYLEAPLTRRPPLGSALCGIVTDLADALETAEKDNKEMHNGWATLHLSLGLGRPFGYCECEKSKPWSGWCQACGQVLKPTPFKISNQTET